MTEVNKNSEANTNFESSSINLNEDDWTQLLQKLSPSSLDSLQQTLRRMQQSEVNRPTSKHTESILLSNPIQQIPVSNSNMPLFMSLDVNRTPVQPVINVSRVLNISNKTVTNSLSNAIVLPTSTILIQNPNPCQTFTLDSCVPVTGLTQLVASSPSITNQTNLEFVTTRPKTPETFNSLNTLANAAVAMAARAPFQVSHEYYLL